MTDALSGVRVVDMATVVAGPGTAKYVADFGADVIKVEAPSGDPARRLGWTAAGDQDSLFWKILGRGKRCITLDLKDPADVATRIVEKLVLAPVEHGRTYTHTDF